MDSIVPTVLWYLATTAVALAFAPLVMLAFRHVADRGASLVRPLGLLALVWPVWFLASLGDGVVPFDGWALWTVLAAIAVVSWLVAIRAGASGDISLEDGAEQEGVAWVVQRAGPPMASPALYRGYLYVLDQRGGLLACYEAATGKLAYRERVDGAAGFTSSPICSGGKVYCLDQDGQMFVIEAGPEYKLVAENKLDGMYWSSPAVVDGTLLIRSVDELHCVAQK